MLEETVRNVSSLQRLLQDCCYLHADINNKEHPKIHLKFGGSIIDVIHQDIYSETLFLEKINNED